MDPKTKDKEEKNLRPEKGKVYSKKGVGGSTTEQMGNDPVGTLGLFVSSNAMAWLKSPDVPNPDTRDAVLREMDESSVGPMTLGRMVDAGYREVFSMGWRTGYHRDAISDLRQGRPAPGDRILRHTQVSVPLPLENVVPVVRTRMVPEVGMFIFKTRLTGSLNASPLDAGDPEITVGKDSIELDGLTKASGLLNALSLEAGFSLENGEFTVLKFSNKLMKLPAPTYSFDMKTMSGKIEFAPTQFDKDVGPIHLSGNLGISINVWLIPTMKAPSTKEIFVQSLREATVEGLPYIKVIGGALIIVGLVASAPEYAIPAAGALVTSGAAASPKREPKRKTK